MTRGLLSGILWGAVLSIGAAIALSTLVPLPPSPQVQMADPESAASPAMVTDTPQVTVQELDTAPAAAPQVVLEDPAKPDNVDVAAVAPAAQPDVGDAEALAPPSAEASDAAVAVTEDSAVLPNPQALAPMAPPETDAVTVDTQPAPQPIPKPIPEAVFGPAPQVDEDAPRIAQAPAASEDVALNPGEVLPEEGAPQIATPAATPQPDAPTAPQVDETLAAQPEPEPEEVAEPATDASTVTDAPDAATDAPVVTDVPEAATDAPVVADVPEAATDAPDVADEPDAATDAPEVAEAPEAATDAPVVTEVPDPQPAQPAEATPGEEAGEDGDTQTATLDTGVVRRPLIGKPATTLTDSRAGVRINRAIPAADTARVAVAPAEGAKEADADRSDLPPFARYAKSFSNPDDKPLMAIVLIDDGADLKAAEGGLAALRRFPYPISFAINANLPDANARMDAYRAEGFEVLAMVDLPDGAQPADAEVTLSVALEKLPETVAVLDGVRGGLQPNRETADQVTAILAQTGHGLVAQAQGLNTMPKLANKAGVPAAPVFRDFDSKDQTATVIRRFLDQAAFKAGQEGAVIMLGRIRPETIQALLVWGLADRAGQVALAPISAALTAQ